ncbi:MAG TPA: NAD(P)H-dependent glycerol-3-phosphate dehydrogenase [Planctomycetota bacterium]|nr:NAD(P)H-dependent glycerol-3-phosphate dehydrogenase [Planctomycetota bacterium]
MEYDIPINNARLCILGAGAFGTAMAIHFARLGHTVRLWGRDREAMDRMQAERINRRRLPGIQLPELVLATSDLEVALGGIDLVIVALPTQKMRSVLTGLKDRWPQHNGVRVGAVSIGKGIELETNLRTTEIIEQSLGAGVPIGGLWGPTLAYEVAVGRPAAMVTAAKDPEFAHKVQLVAMGPTMRVYTNDDLVGVEISGALKNVVAIAAGICDGLGMGENSKASLVTRGLTEISRFGRELGGKSRTFMGLCGMGDLMLTCYSPRSRNYNVGLGVGKGENLDRVLARLDAVAEGVSTVRSVTSQAAKFGIEMPIASAVQAILIDGKDLKASIQDLMTRTPKDE